MKQVKWQESLFVTIAVIFVVASILGGLIAFIWFAPGGLIALVAGAAIFLTLWHGIHSQMEDDL